jgi:lipopolysaccharide assembly protein A
MRIISYIILLVIMVIGLTFAALNAAPVTFNYYLGTKTLALSMLLVFSFGIGLLLGGFVTFFSWLKLKKDNLFLKSRLKVVEKEVENLRTIPVKSDY